MATERKNGVMTQRWLDGRLETVVHGTSGGDVSIVFDPARASATNRARAMAFGWQQRLADAGAIETTDAYGNEVPAAQRADQRANRLTALRDHYETGTEEWRLVSRAATGAPDAGLTILAMIRAGLASDANGANGMVAGIAAKRGIDRSAALRLWAGSDRVAAAIAEIKAERAPVSAADLEAELMAD